MEDLKSPREILRDFEDHAKEDLLEELEKAVAYQRVRQALLGVKTLLEFECDAALLANNQNAGLVVPGLQRAIEAIENLMEKKNDDNGRIS